jgi:diguanylate cyclase (GGDEF)-like protein
LRIGGGDEYIYYNSTQILAEKATNMVGSYDYRLVLLSLLVVFVSCLVTFSLSAKVYRSEPRIAKLWRIGGALAIGTGIWSMHFIGMLAFSLPIAVGYALDYTALSWLIAIAVSWFALQIASLRELTTHILLVGSLFMGAGISGVYYISMYAMHLSPPIIYDPLLVMLSVLTAIAASMAAIHILFRLRVQRFESAFLPKILAAMMMSAALAGVHYTGMAAARFAPNTFCSNAVVTNPSLLALVIALGATGLMLSTFIISILDTRSIRNSLSRDMSLQDANHELSRMAMIDALTQLPNRRAFLQHLELGIRRTSRLGSSLAVAFIDIDHFKPINDAYGHHVGDEVLRAIAMRLNAAFRGCDIVARMGGDEFVALIEDIKTDQDIVPIVERIIHSLRDVFYIDNHEIIISASVGIAVSSRDGDMERLMRCADAAMYRAKNDGKNRFRFFDSDIALASDRLLEMQSDLRDALSRNEFKLYFQPKVDSRTHALVGVEALLRWQHPIKGTISPEIFIPAAERFGLINQIGDWVIEESCRVLHRLRRQNVTLKIAINLSPQQFRNPNLVTNILEVLKRFDLPHSSIMFEVSEAAGLQNPKQFNMLFNDFREAEIELAMDKFGTGNSSLAHLQRVKVNQLKLDHTFIADISTNKKSLAITNAIIDLAHALDLVVVAAGIETEEQRKILTELGCDQLQGFLFSHPVPEEHLASLIHQIAAIYKDAD